MADEDTTGSAELARGHVTLTVAYKGAQSQVADDFQKIGEQGKQAGAIAGQGLHEGIVGGLQRTQNETGGFLSAMRTSMVTELGNMGDGAADSFRGHIVTGIAGALGNSNGGGILGDIVSRFKRTGDDAGKSISEGLGKGLDAASDKAREAGEAVETLGLESGSAAVQLGGIGSAIAGIVSDPVLAATAAVVGLVAGVGLLTEKLSDMGEMWETTTDSLETRTGAAGERLEGLKSVVESIAPTLDLPIEKIGGIVGVVSQQFGDSGRDLADVATTLGRLQAVFGDVNLSQLGDITRQYNLDAKDQLGLVNGLIGAYQQSGTPIDSFAAALDRSAPVAKQLGLNVGDLTGFMASLAKEGEDPSKGVIALSTAATKFANEGKDGNAALKDLLQNIQALEKAGNAPGAEALADKYFGGGVRGAGAPIADALKSGALDPNNLAAGVKPLNESLDQLYEKTKHAGGAWEEMKNSVVVALAPLSEKVHAIVDKDLTAISEWIGTHKQDIVTFFGAAAIAATDFGQGIAVIIGGVIQIFGDLIGATAKASRGIGDLLGGVASAVEALPDWLGGGKENAKGIRDAANSVYNFGQEAQHASDETTAFGRNVQTQANSMAASIRSDITGAIKESRDEFKQTDDTAKNLVDTIKSLDGVRPKLDIDIDPAKSKMDQFLSAYGRFFATDGTPAVAQVPGSYTPPTGGQPSIFAGLPPRADGGEIGGSGAKGVDSQLIYAAPGEHMWTADEVEATGGQAAQYHLRALARAGLLKGYAGGGEVGPDVAVANSMVGTGYNQGNRDDCSGMVGRVVEGATGLGGPLPTTQNMASWLAERGFVNGVGPDGSLSVGWYNHGSAPNDGHAAMTLSNGENAESGGSHGNFLVGAGAAGAENPEFDHHMYLPNVYGEGNGGSGIVGGLSGSSGGVSAAQIQAADDAVTSATGAVTVATQKLQEATNAPLATTKDGKPTKNAQEDHDKAVTAAQAQLAAANRDLATAQQQRANVLSGGDGGLIGAENALAAAVNHRADAQARLDAVQADPKHKPDQLTKAQNDLATATTKVTEAQQRLATEQQKQTGSKDNPFSALGQVGGDVLKDNLPPGFSDPTSWPLVKTAGNLLKDLGGYVQDPTARALLTAGGSAVGGDFGGAVSGLVSAIPKPYGAITIGSPGDAPGADDAVPPPGSTGGLNLDPSAFIPNLPNIGGDHQPEANGKGDTNIDASTTIHGKADGDTQDAAAKQNHRDVRTKIPRMVQQGAG